MLGFNTSKSIPKLIKTHMLYKVELSNNTDFYFCYKNTIKNVEIIENIKKNIYSAKV